MIAAPSGTRVWLAAGITDMRRGMDGLAALVQSTLGRDPFSGHTRPLMQRASTDPIRSPRSVASSGHLYDRLRSTEAFMPDAGLRQQANRAVRKPWDDLDRLCDRRGRSLAPP
ncbi:transposase [Paraburkholderia tropica]|uniref:IS66 family insertion sequence element accessory protein TnpB n=1 Tax=Paraburkholderia tropica TaxID=92647 RepID=UPI0016045A7D|nr:transposase [Paraburkholderia tropica]